MTTSQNRELDPRSSGPAPWNALDSFFFLPSRPETLAIMRVMTGLMIAYIHWVWMLDLESFMGANALLDNETWRTLHRGSVPDTKWTYLSAIDSMTWIRLHEGAACIFGLLMAVGLLTRFACVLAWFLTLMTVHRMTGFLFGLDQVTLMLAMYLCLSRCGSAYSLDVQLVGRYPNWFEARRWAQWLSGIVFYQSAIASHCWSNTLSTRLIQLHLCVIYLFGGIGKMRGETWWDGSALWYSVAAYEYQSLDMTWIGHFPLIASIATHVTVFWEMAYCAIVWPRWLRPWALGIACMVHGGIALFLGMITFGMMMIVANLAFVCPESTQRIVGWIRNRVHRGES
ncbi:MAG: HTTM domain-containing protein [Pirellula sp.]